MIREDLKAFILKKVKEETTLEKPYYFIRWSGLYELAKSYHIDLLELIDEMCREGLIKKALVKKKLALYLPDRAPSKKLKQLKQEFENFIKKD